MRAANGRWARMDGNIQTPADRSNAAKGRESQERRREVHLPGQVSADPRFAEQCRQIAPCDGCIDPRRADADAIRPSPTDERIAERKATTPQGRPGGRGSTTNFHLSPRPCGNVEAGWS